MNNLAEIMQREKVTAEQLAKITGLAPGTIRRTMSNRDAVPYNSTALKLSQALGYTVAQIRGEKEI